MNQLRSWLYGHDTRSHYAREDSTDVDGRIHDSTTARSRSRSTANEDGVNRTNVNTMPSGTEKGIANSLRNTILKVVPLKPGDCLECKLVGTFVMMASGFIVLGSAVTAKQRNPNLRQFNGALYAALCGGLFLGFEATAVCRLMDWGPFDKT